MNIDSVKTVFLKGFYAEAAPFMQQYIDRLETELIKSGEWLDIYGSPVHHEKSFLSTENIAFYNNLFDEAELAVAKCPEVVQRVKVSRLPVEFATMDDNIAFRKKATALPGPDPKYSGGNMTVITNGVQGADSYKVHWLGWENEDPQITMDLGEAR